MAKATGKAHCDICNKEKATLMCRGCSKDFCYDHIADHRQDLNKHLLEIEGNRDLLQQTLNEEKTNPQRSAWTQQVDDWERESIEKIQQTAKEIRKIIFKHTSEHITQIELRMNELTDQLRQCGQENDFFEPDLRRWNKELTRLEKELRKRSNINLRQDITPLIPKMYVDVTVVPLCIPKIDANAGWSQNGNTIAGGNGQGDGLNQLNYPNGIYVDDDQTVYVTDISNHRIMQWKSGATSGEIVAGGNGSGIRNDQLNYPTDVIFDKENDCLFICDHDNRRVVQWPRRNGTTGETIITDVHCWGLAMDTDGYLYVSDISKHEVRRWEVGDTHGTVVAGGNGQGNRLDQLDHPSNIFVDGDHSVYVSDLANQRVIKWNKDAAEGIVVAGGLGQGNDLTQLSGSYGVIVDQLGAVYVSDYHNNRVMRWPQGAKEGSIAIGGNEEGRELNQITFPVGLSFDRQGNLYVVDNGNQQVQKFNVDLNSNS